MAHYVAMRLLPIYLELNDQLADSAILAGDDTSITEGPEPLGRSDGFAG